MSDPLPTKPSRPRRPAYLVVALLACWAMGAFGTMQGCGVLRFYRQPDTSSLDAEKPGKDGQVDYLDQVQREVQKAEVAALEQHRDRMIPLAVANLLLSLVLLFACARALGAKHNAHHLALQVVYANMLYVVANYFVAAPVRAARLAVLGSIPLPKDSEPLDPALFQTVGLWVMRIPFALQLGVLGLVAFALTRPGVVAFFRHKPNHEPTEEV